MSALELTAKVSEKAGVENIEPDLFYLMEYGSIVMEFSDEEKTEIKGVRLTAAGIDLYEQLVLKKYQF
jgi:hypothetical protein